jgi:hypothetical protein
MRRFAAVFMALTAAGAIAVAAEPAWLIEPQPPGVPGLNLDDAEEHTFTPGVAGGRLADLRRLVAQHPARMRLHVLVDRQKVHGMHAAADHRLGQFAYVSIPPGRAKPKQDVGEMDDWAFLGGGEGKPGPLIVNGRTLATPVDSLHRPKFAGRLALVPGSEKTWVNGKQWPGSPADVHLSPNGRHVAYTDSLGLDKGRRLIVGGRAVATADRFGAFAITADNRLVYLASTKQGEKRTWQIGVGAKVYGPLDRVTGFTLSHDGNHIGAVVDNVADDKQHVFLDGRYIMTVKRAAIVGFDADNRLIFAANDEQADLRTLRWDGAKATRIAPAEAVISDDGRHLAWAEPTDDNKTQVMRDGKPVGTAHRYISNVRLSPDGRQVAYIASTLGDAPDVGYLNEAPAARGASLGKPIFSPDGRHVAFRAYDEGWFDPGHQLQINGRTVAKARWLHDLTWSNRGGHWAILAGPKQTYPRPEGDWHVLISGKVLGPFTDKPDPVIMLDDGRVVFVAPSGDKKFRVHHGKAVGRAYAQVESVCVSPDRRHFAYRAGSDALSTKTLVLDGQTFKLSGSIGHVAFIGNHTLRALVTTGEAFAFLDVKVRDE